jgi:hypothetical protein
MKNFVSKFLSIKMKYACTFLMMLNFLNFNAQGTWKHIKYNMIPGLYSTLAYTHSTDLSNGNTVSVGINYLDENEIYEIITILDQTGKPIRDIESRSLGTKVLMYVQDMPLQQKFFYVGFDLLSSTWYLTHMDYQGDIIKVDSIKSNSSSVKDFIFSIKKRDNGNIILSTFSYLGVGQSILCELTPEGTFLQTQLVDTTAPTIFIPKRDNTGYVCFGENIFEMDDKFNVTNESNEFQFNELSGVDAVRVGSDYVFLYTDGDGNLQLVKLNSALDVVKQKELAAEAYGERFVLSSIALDNDGNMLIGNNFTDEFTFDYFTKLYKVDSDLNVIFEEEIIGEDHELYGLSLTSTKDKSILLSGFGYPIDNDNYADAFVYKLDENGKLSSIGDQTELSATSMVYPNPVKDLCKINFPSEGLYDLKLVNIFGQEIYYRLSDITANTATIDLSNVRNGIYFLQISQANRHMESIKVVKI